MKKLRNLFVILMCVISLFCMTGCGKKKTPLTADEFYSKVEAKNFIIQNSKSQYSSHDEITESYVAAPSSLEYQIEFIVLDSASSAKDMYAHNKEIFEDAKKNATTKLESSVSVSNYSKYTLQVGGKYKVLSRIDNTLVYINADENYKNDINSLLEELGY